MSLYVPEHFSTVRRVTRAIAQRTPAELVDSIPPGCHNNVRWLLGHVTLSSERLILGLAGEPVGIPDTWGAWFSRDTSPDAFTADTPDWPALLAALDESTARLLAHLPTANPGQKLARPFEPKSAPIRLETVGETIAMATWHEGLHVGQMMTYSNLLRHG